MKWQRFIFDSESALESAYKWTNTALLTVLGESWQPENIPGICYWCSG